MHYSLRPRAGGQPPAPAPDSPRTLSNIIEDMVLAAPCVFLLRKFSGVAVDALMSRMGLATTPLAVLYSAARPECALARPPATLASLATCWAPHMVQLAAQCSLTSVLLCLRRDSVFAMTREFFTSWTAIVQWGIVLFWRRPRDATLPRVLLRHARLYAMYLATMAAYYMLEVVAVVVWHGPEALVRKARMWREHAAGMGYWPRRSRTDDMSLEQAVGSVMQEFERVAPMIERSLMQMGEKAGFRDMFGSASSSPFAPSPFAYQPYSDVHDAFLGEVPAAPSGADRFQDWRLYMPMVFLGGLLGVLYAWPHIDAAHRRLQVQCAKA